jgi:hypothetical protein
MKTPKNGKISWRVNCSGSATKSPSESRQSGMNLGFYRVCVVIDLTKSERQGHTKMSDKTRQKPPLVVDADQFDSVLKRLIEHKPVPKKSIKTSRKQKRGKILSK